ncbi:MAG: SoxR reducing system RseC family protein [Spirochaetes bacterium]|nr:SoxR reducing system RseC family protein [Spirochaetota bacterium]
MKISGADNMNEEGTVVRVEGNRARVLATRGSACESCGSRSLCHPFGGNSKNVEIEAINAANARVGNVVNISIQSSTVMKAAFIVYMIPILMLFAGVFLGKWFADKNNYDADLISLLAGIFAFSVTFLILKLTSKRFSGKAEYIPVITEIKE